MTEVTIGEYKEGDWIRETRGDEASPTVRDLQVRSIVEQGREAGFFAHICSRLCERVHTPTVLFKVPLEWVRRIPDSMGKIVKIPATVENGPWGYRVYSPGEIEVRVSPGSDPRAGESQ